MLRFFRAGRALPSRARGERAKSSVLIPRLHSSKQLSLWCLWAQEVWRMGTCLSQQWNRITTENKVALTAAADL